jgi:hypothetical protein
MSAISAPSDVDLTKWYDPTLADANWQQALLWGNRVDLAASAVCPVIGPFQTWRFAIEGAGPDAIQAPKLEPRIMRYDFNGHEGVVIKLGQSAFGYAPMSSRPNESPGTSARCAHCGGGGFWRPGRRKAGPAFDLPTGASVRGSYHRCAGIRDGRRLRGCAAHGPQPTIVWRP